MLPDCYEICDKPLKLQEHPTPQKKQTNKIPYTFVSIINDHCDIIFKTKLTKPKEREIFQ